MDDTGEGIKSLSVSIILDEQGDRDTDGRLWTRYDSQGYPMLLWDTKGFPNYHAEVPRRAIA